MKYYKKPGGGDYYHGRIWVVRKQFDFFYWIYHRHCKWQYYGLYNKWTHMWPPKDMKKYEEISEEEAFLEIL